MNAKGIFITATGTDIGKTYVSGLIVKKMREYGFNCGYYKPVLSGAIKDKNGKLIPGDCKHVVDTSKLNVEPLSVLSYCFEDAVSPHLASERKSIIIQTERILSDFKNIASNYDYILVEGAGGITCPLRKENDGSIYMISDLINDLGLSTLVVADGGLGTINSVVTTVEYMKNRNINIEGLILNNFDSNNFMHADNLIMVEKLTGLKVVATVSSNENDLKIDKKDLLKLFV